MEEKRTAELLSDFEDYDIGDSSPDALIGATKAAKNSRKRPRSA